ncbi:MAG: carbohydrate ABC transporter permease [Anaerolineales bacterium]|nr:carbohydrate ABC transporter permease [Anaerolineales bacterium]
MTTTALSKAPRKKLRLNFAYFILAPAALVSLLPFIWMIFGSFKTGAEIRQVPPTFFPKEFTLENYKTVLTDPDLPLTTFYRNSAVIALANVVQVLFTSSLFGYIFAKFDFKGRRYLFWFILATMMIPHQITMIPGYLILSKLGLINKLWGLIIPAAIDAFGIFLFRQFALSIPSELIDAARVDGAGEFQIYWQIVLPQLGPALATFGMLTFMFNWNAYLWPLIVLTEQDVRTLPIILTWYSNRMSNRYHLTMAASVLVVAPVLFIFMLVQRWIVEGIALTGIKS